MTQTTIQTHLRSVGTDMVETAELLKVSVTTVRNGLNSPNKLSTKMWSRLEQALNKMGLGERYE